MSEGDHMRGVTERGSGGVLPSVSVVIETFTMTHDYPAAAPAESPLVGVLEGLRRQDYPRELLEVVVVLDEETRALADFLRAAYPHVGVLTTSGGEYFSMKTFGARHARGEVVAFLDSDCVPVEDWVRLAVARIEEGADAVAGKTRYRPQTLAARTHGVFDFGHVQAGRRGEATSLMANNAAFRREVFIRHPFDPRLRRSGADYMLACELKARGYRVVYEPRLYAAHEYDIETMGFVVKRVRAGYDALNVSRVDAAGVVRETRLARARALAPLAVFLSRFLFDCTRFVRNRRDLGIRPRALPYFLGASLLMRGIELAAGLVTVVRPDYFRKKYHW